MKPELKFAVRRTRAQDWRRVEQVTFKAFNAPPPAGENEGNEALLVTKLRRSGAYLPELDFVAEFALGRPPGWPLKTPGPPVFANIMYTKSRIEGGGKEWDALTFGPLSVLPGFQGRGAGSALVRASLAEARALGWRAALIYGHESYYPRFGFRPAAEFGISTSDGKNFPAFMALPLYEGALDGVRGRLFIDAAFADLDKEESDRLNASLAADFY